MKKKITLFITFITLFSFVFSLSFVKAAIKEGDTLKKLRGQLSSLQAKKASQDAAKKKTKSEIEASKRNMENAKNEVFKARAEVEDIKVEIANTDKEIEQVKDESKDLIRLYQELQSENVYASYITGASSMTELIMRYDAISQIAEYNEKELNKLELLTDSNEKLQKELVKYQEDLAKKITNYENSIDELGDTLAELEEGAVTIQEEINSMKELIKYYEDFGCKEDEDLIACVNAITNNKEWLKPVYSAKITSVVGYRNRPTASASSNHKGIDMAVPEGTPVYPTANGQVGAIVRKSSCGGNMLYIWTIVQGKKYTYVFMHLKDIQVKVGQEVKVTDVVAHSGGGKSTMSYDRCTTGAHLHYGLAEGHFFGAVGDLALSKFNAYIINPPGYPNKGGRFSGR